MYVKQTLFKICSRPIVLRVSTREILEQNKNVEITNINCGATRPSGTLGGIAAPRGKDTFKSFELFQITVGKVAEVTFPDHCILPTYFDLGTSPDGPWTKVNL